MGARHPGFIAARNYIITSNIGSSPISKNRIKGNEIEAYFNSSVQEIGVDHVVINTPGGPLRLKERLCARPHRLSP